MRLSRSTHPPLGASALPIAPYIPVKGLGRGEVQLRRLVAGLAVVSVIGLAAAGDTTTSKRAKQKAEAADPRVATLEDFYGDTGTQFRGALGFRTREADAFTTGG